MGTVASHAIWAAMRIRATVWGAVTTQGAGPASLSVLAIE
jgi:hypothetical protein